MDFPNISVTKQHKNLYISHPILQFQYISILWITVMFQIIRIMPSYKSSVLLLLLLLHRNWCTILDLCLKYEIMDGFWNSRCLNDRIDVHHKIGSFSSGATTSMVVKNGTKKTLGGLIGGGVGEFWRKKILKKRFKHFVMTPWIPKSIHYLPF